MIKKKDSKIRKHLIVAFQEIVLFPQRADIKMRLKEEKCLYDPRTHSNHIR